MSENIFQKACLIQLSTSCWQGVTTLQPNVMERIGNSEWLKGAKILVNPESLSPVRSQATKARTMLQKSALPFPVKGLTLVPKEALRRIDESLEEIRQEFDAEVEIFISKYEDERQEARGILGDLFSDSDYPVDIRSKFHFEWRFLTLDVPGKSRILPAEVYEREMQKFQAMMGEARDLAVAALREEFAGIVAHIGDRLRGRDDGKAKRFRISMVERLREFVESFSDRNLFQDELLENLVEQARNLLNGVSSVNLRKDEGLRDTVGVEMGRIKLAIDEAMEDLPRRKIRLAA